MPFSPRKKFVAIIAGDSAPLHIIVPFKLTYNACLCLLQILSFFGLLVLFIVSQLINELTNSPLVNNNLR